MAPAMTLLPALLRMPEFALPALVLKEIVAGSVRLVLFTLPSRTRAAVPVLVTRTESVTVPVPSELLLMTM